MWAGPLCGQLLARAGATVVKVESTSRPDGARAGPRAFFDWMNGGKLSYLVDFDKPSAVLALLAAADVVIESSRPAALTRRGLGPTTVSPRDGRVWLRITGHGTEGERANWVAFGDDAAVSGGLVCGGDDAPVFCGDAIADPLTGLHAAVAVAQSLRSGGGELIEMSLSAVAATYAELPRTERDRVQCNSAIVYAGIGVGCRQRDRRAADLRETLCFMLIQRAALLDGGTADIRVEERIVEVAARLSPNPGEQVYDAAGGTVIPGLHDHHVHLRSAAAALTSTRVGPADVHTRADLALALAAADVGADGWIRAVGYHEAVAGPLDRAVLDDLSPPVPVRIQHRSGVLWTLNSAGLAQIGLADHPDGRLRSADRSWSDALLRNEIELTAISRRLSAYGVTGVTDATPDMDVADVVKLMEAHRRGELHQRVHCLAPGKRILHDTDLDLAGLAEWIAAAPRRRRTRCGALCDGRATGRHAVCAAVGGRSPAGPHRARRRGARRQRCGHSSASASPS